jgi:hypothetical protein
MARKGGEGRRDRALDQAVKRAKGKRGEAAAKLAAAVRAKRYYDRHAKRIAQRRADVRLRKLSHAREGFRVRTYADLIHALREVRAAMGMTLADVDDRSGLQSGYASKIEAGMRGLGKVSLPLLLDTYGAELLIAIVPRGERFPPPPEHPVKRRRVKVSG